MTIAGPGPADRSDRSGAGSVSPFRRLLWLGGFALTLAAALLAGGFVWFVHRLPAAPAEAGRADGIVALTGAASRINDALALLAAGHGSRLLITGVNPVTRPEEIQRQVPEHRRLFACCVDLDHSAVNTIGNAVETSHWARERGFRSLIVVTSNFHMPRSMVELAHRMPGADLLPYPVVSDPVRVEEWWKNPAIARLLFSEYLKYIVAVARVRLAATVA